MNVRHAQQKHFSRRNRPWLLLVLWPLLCSAWLSSAHDPDACVTSAASQHDTEAAQAAQAEATHHHTHLEGEDHHHSYAHETTPQQRVLDIASAESSHSDRAQVETAQVETAHLQTHRECASCSWISASAAFHVVAPLSLHSFHLTSRQTTFSLLSLQTRHARGFSTRGPPFVFA